MTTKNEMIEIIKSENPNGLKTGSEETGYYHLTPEEYKIKIEEWADARLAKEQAQAEAETLRQTKIAAYQKLGLTAEEIEALVPTPKLKDLGGN
jgi:hypothetical protein